ncbi:MAG: DUF1906 domain-containing protein [Actinobacteria bacterium]|nr:DUF1906 domain-containing protein [Actinomycetota bacterium]MBI3688471.1 DUF1906 domain-containing protein [Actinomycetota bacterium]
MRRSSVQRLIGTGVATVLVAGLGVAAGASPGRSGEPTRTVTYHGVRLTVPASWPVIDLTANPTACVRLDRAAVYLGQPGPDQDCPAGLVGRTDTVLIEPLRAGSGPQARAGTITVPAGGRMPASVPVTMDREATIAVQGASVLVHVTYGADPSLVGRIVAGASVTSTAAPAGKTAEVSTAAPLLAPPPAGQTVIAPGTFTGGGFDACAAPSSGAMDAWLGAPYRAVGVYLGGGARACAQPNLTAAWVSRQSSRGWHLVPIYVGLQAPCTAYSYRINPPTATAQGRLAADDAANKAAALGLAPGSTVYDDMEAFPTSAPECSTAVLQYLSGWTARLHERGYLSGAYSSASSGVAVLAAVTASAAYQGPDHIFFARWNGVASTVEPVLPDSMWSSHQRIKQYLGGHDERYGNVTINIDSDYLDVGGARDQPAASGTRLLSAGSGVVYRALADGTLSWNRQLDPASGAATWAAATNLPIGSGWNAYTRVAAAGDGVLYAVDAGGNLHWYRHLDPAGGSATWAPGSGAVIGSGWSGYRQIFAGAAGAIYGLDAKGDLHWYRHLDPAGGAPWWGGGAGQVVTSGWGSVAQVTSGRDGVIYATTTAGQLRWYRHDDPTGGAAIWGSSAGRVIATGWGSFRQIVAAGDGVVYVTTAAGQLRWYRHADPAGGSPRWAPGSGQLIGQT